jgi:hypothetical protein
VGAGRRGVVFAISAITPMARGGDMNHTLLVLAVVFVIIGYKKARRGQAAAPEA